MYIERVRKTNTFTFTCLRPNRDNLGYKPFERTFDGKIYVHLKPTMPWLDGHFFKSAVTRNKVFLALYIKHHTTKHKLQFSEPVV